MVFSDRIWNFTLFVICLKHWTKWLGEIAIGHLARSLHFNQGMYIILLFQVCNFHYWLAKSIKSNRCRSTAWWPHIQLPSPVQRLNSFFCSLRQSSRKWETANKNFAMRKVFKNLCISLGKILPMENFQLQTVQDIHVNVSFTIAWEAFFTGIFLQVLSSCQYWAWHGKTVISSCKAQSGWFGWIWGLRPGTYKEFSKAAVAAPEPTWEHGTGTEMTSGSSRKKLC